MNARARRIPGLLAMAALSLALLMTSPAQAQRDTQSEKVRLQAEEDRLNKQIAWTEKYVVELKDYEGYLEGLLDPKVILVFARANPTVSSVPTKAPDGSDDSLLKLSVTPVAISQAQLDALVRATAMYWRLHEKGDVNLHVIREEWLSASESVQRYIEDRILVEIRQATVRARQDLDWYRQERERVRADFARLTGQTGGTGETGEGRTYDDKGKSVYVSFGEQSFADELVSTTPGTPAPKATSGTDPAGALKRDFNSAADTGYYTLGCHGSVTLRFSQVYLVDGPDADLYVFEVGPDVEGTKLEVRTEDGPWVQVGEIGGGAVQVDIHKALASRGMLDQRFSQVRLTDLGQKCAGNWPGADIDAVAALHSIKR
jgi:hypothetical protein